MNPLEFDWTDSQQVTITNPTAEDHIWKVYGKEYRLPAGRSAQVPGYIAWIYVYNMAAMAAQADKKWDRWNEIEVRKDYFAKFVVGIQPIIQEIELEPDPVQLVDEDDDEELGGDSHTGDQSANSSKTKDKRHGNGSPQPVK
jgi:hypothetical protein